MYFHYRKTVGGEILNTPLVSNVGLKGLYFYNVRLVLNRGETQGRN